MLNNQKLNPVSQFALLVAFTGLGILLLTGLSVIIAAYVLDVKVEKFVEAIYKPENLQVARLLQVFSSFLMWGVPAIVVAAVSGKDPVRQLGFNETLSGRQLLIVLLLIIAAFFLTGALSELTRMIPIPESSARYFQGWEDDFNKQVLAFANMKNISDYIFAIMIIAVVPALFEEMFFRGCLQQIMTSLTKSPFWGILITSIIFSLVHKSYYAFLPRFFLGFMLGYIFYYSKNIWLNVIAHFINNAIGITLIYSLTSKGKLTPDALNDTALPLYYGILGALAIWGLFLFFRKESNTLLAANTTE